jgi:hypothetical protein
MRDVINIKLSSNIEDHQAATALFAFQRHPVRLQTKELRSSICLHCPFILFEPRNNTQKVATTFLFSPVQFNVTIIIIYIIIIISLITK